METDICIFGCNIFKIMDITSFFDSPLQVPIISQYSLFSLGTITVSLWSSIMVINIHGFPDALQVCEIKMAPPKIVRLCRKLWPYISYSHGQEQQQHPSPSFGKNRSTVDDQTPVYCNGRSRMLVNNRFKNQSRVTRMLEKCTV